MPAKEVSMRKIKEVLRLRFELQLSQHVIATSLNLSVGVVNKYLAFAKAAAVKWPLPPEIQTDDDLRHYLLKAAPCPPALSAPCPDYAVIHQELKRKGVTLLLLWEEYRAIQPQAYSYSQYCLLYRTWRQSQQRSMRQNHRAGDKLFIDYAGPTVPIVDSITGEIHPAAIFVAILGASNYTFAEATWDQGLPHWIASHVRAFQFFQGVPALLVPDNLRAAIQKACRYEPQVNSTYADMAAYYGTAILPARPYKPKDKAKAENAVLIVERWILARLRHLTFFSLAELNTAIAHLLADLNHRPFKKLVGSRASQFEQLDKPALRPLPVRPYEFAQFKGVRVGIDYHVELDRHYYSVPHTLARQLLDLRYTVTTVELFYKSKRIASHVRSYRIGQHTTLAEHMPISHRKQLEWTPERFLNWAAEIGPATCQLVHHLLASHTHPEQGYRSCLGLLPLAKRYTALRLEAACVRALTIGAPSRRSVASILDKGLDQQPLSASSASATSPTPDVLTAHDNVRGAHYYEEVS